MKHGGHLYSKRFTTYTMYTYPHMSGQTLRSLVANIKLLIPSFAFRYDMHHYELRCTYSYHKH